MNDKHPKKLFKATEALLGTGSIEHAEPKFNQKDLDHKFRIREDRTGKAKIEEVSG